MGRTARSLSVRIHPTRQDWFRQDWFHGSYRIQMTAIETWRSESESFPRASVVDFELAVGQPSSHVGKRHCAAGRRTKSVCAPNPHQRRSEYARRRPPEPPERRVDSMLAAKSLCACLVLSCRATFSWQESSDSYRTPFICNELFDGRWR